MLESGKIFSFQWKTGTSEETGTAAVTLDVLNIQTYCTTAGSGPHLLFLHGWGVGHELYTPLLEHLQKTHTVFAPDLPGFGKTGEPPEPWGVDEYAAFTLEFLRVAGAKPSVMMGHSNGGRVLLNLLPKYDLGAKKLVLMGSAGLKPKRGLQYYAKVYTYKAGKALLTPFPALKRRLTENRGSEDYRRASPVMKATMSRLLASDATALLPLINIPTLLIWGVDDTAAPLSDAKIMEREIPDAGLALLPGGHWAFMEQLPRTMRILDSFL